MFQKFQVDNLISRFIKCLLWDTYLPLVNTWKPNQHVIKGYTYIAKEGYIAIANKTSTKGETLPTTVRDSDWFTIVKPYIAGKYYAGITSNYESTSSLYDSNTHKMLGQYLRLERDLCGLDLMPYYNCYADEIYSQENGVAKYLVPIKLNQAYSIYYDSSFPARIYPVYYNGITLTKIVDKDNKPIREEKSNTLSHSKPYVYKGLGNSQGVPSGAGVGSQLAEDYLNLVIEVPFNPKSNLVVLEGDYSKQSLVKNSTLEVHLPNKYFDMDSLKLMDVENIFQPYPSLVESKGSQTVAFSDRLIEYLLKAPIIDRYSINNNIEMVQSNISSSKAKEIFGERYENIYVKGIWDNNLRAYIYNLVTSKYKQPLIYDINGFVDKDTEFILDKGKSD